MRPQAEGKGSLPFRVRIGARYCFRQTETHPPYSLNAARPSGIFYFPDAAAKRGTGNGCIPRRYPKKSGSVLLVHGNPADHPLIVRAAVAEKGRVGMAGLDAGKLNRVNLARRTFMKPWQEYTMNDRVQWCVAAVPAPGWAAKVFPELPLDEAVEKLWALIFDVCRVSTGDPVGAWQKHVAVTKARRDRMNALELDRIHMTSSNGTDLTVGLADDATWEGASSKTEDGIEFIANVPTEEVFCAPHRERTNGIVYGTKPYAYNGQLIEGWHVTFKDGVVVEHGAEKNADLLAELLSTDENSNRIGEIALVPASSPINRSGVLFYNTLFDENAACHIAFGAGYPTNIRGGSAMTRDDLMKKGLNNSAIHEDVMIGAADTHVTGITKRGEEVTIFENGEWAF